MYCKDKDSAEDSRRKLIAAKLSKRKAVRVDYDDRRTYTLERVLLDKYDATFGTTILDKRIELLEAELKRLKDRRN